MNRRMSDRELDMLDQFIIAAIPALIKETNFGERSVVLKDHIIRNIGDNAVNLGLHLVHARREVRRLNEQLPVVTNHE